MIGKVHFLKSVTIYFRRMVMKKSFKLLKSIGISTLAFSLILCSCTSPSIDGQNDAATEGASTNADGSSSEPYVLEDSAAIEYTDNGLIDLGCESRKILSGSLIQEDSTYFYYVINSKLWRTSKDNPDDTVCLFPKDDGYIVDSQYSFTIYGYNVYLFADTLEDYRKCLFRVDRDGNASEVSLSKELSCDSTLDVYNGTLYVYSFDENNRLVSEGFKLDSDGNVGDPYNEFADLTFDFGENFIPIYSNYRNYKFSPASIELFGGIYCLDTVGNTSALYFISAEDSSCTKIADVSDGYVAAITKDKLVMLQKDTHGKCIYTIDLSSGERIDLVNTDSFKDLGYSHSTILSVIDYDDENLFVRIGQPLTEDPVSCMTYDILKVSLIDGSTIFLGSIQKGDLLDSSYEDPVYSFTSKGLTYTNVIDYRCCLCNRSYDDMGSEVVLTTPEYDSNSSVSVLAGYGISLKSLHSAAYYTDDNYDLAVFTADLIIPQLPETSDAFIEFNDTIAENLDVTDMAESSIDDAKSNAESTDPYDEYSPMDLYPYTYSYSFLGISYNDSRYVCLTTSDYEYWGGAHGLGWEYSYTLDMQDGRILSLSDVIGQTQEEFVELVCNHVTDLDEGELFSDYEETAGQIRESYTDNDFNWFLTPEGVAVRFRSYEIAPYASGYPVIVVPYSELTMLIELGN